MSIGEVDKNSIPPAKVMVSVIVPHLNQPELLQRCLESLQVQTFPTERFEILVVDNGSVEMPTKITEQFPTASLLQELEPGPGPARNFGVANSSGEILLFTDADCVVVDNWIETAVTRLTAPDGPKIIGGDVRIPIADPGNPTILEAYEAVFAYQQKKYIKKLGFSGTGNLGMTREVFAAVGGFPGIKVAEDRVWGQRAKSLGFEAEFVKGMIIYHPARENFGVIREKWLRQTTHDFNESKQRGWARTRWTLRIMAVLVSIPVHTFRILSTSNLKGLKARFRATVGLAYVRFYRVRLMSRFLLSWNTEASNMHWNR